MDKEEYQLRQKEKEEKRRGIQQSGKSKKIIKISLMTLILVGGIFSLIWYLTTKPSSPESKIISRQGIHWHPELTIFVNGQKQEIPESIGLGITHQSIHTHDSTGVLHLEMPGLVREEDLRLGQFFKIWGREFNSICIFDKCNSPEGTMKMSVNGKENNEFENYKMRDGDKMEIRYE